MTFTLLSFYYYYFLTQYLLEWGSIIVEEEPNPDVWLEETLWLEAGYKGT